MAFQNFTGSNNNSNNNGGSTPPPSGGGFKNPYMGGGQPTGNDVKEKLINYNEKFKSAQPILFRDQVIEQSLTAANRKKKPNLLLVGPPGVGKTQIVEELARLIESNSNLIPPSLKGKTIYELPLVNITAGTSFRGQMEENIKEIIEFFEDKKNKAILFIDEVHSVLKYDEISQALKPALARENIKFIAATTMTEYNTVMDDPAFSRRITPIIVDELGVSQTTQILKNIYPSYQTFYGNKIVIPEDVIEQIVHVADRNKTQEAHRPDNAITLMDQTMSAMVIDRLKREENARLANDTTLLNILAATPVESVTVKFLNKIAERLRTGNAEVEDDLDAFEEALTHIKGQDHIVDDVLELSKRSKLNINPFGATSPMSFLFVGPSGVGKTEISKLMSKNITGQEPIILNMQEFHSPASINRIIGSPAGYVGSDSKRELPFDILRSNPKRLIVLDELEKADTSVIRLFMTAIDEGYMKDNRNNRIDFSQAIIIATTNAGQTNEKSRPIGFGNVEEEDATIDVSVLENYFDREVINRFKHKLQFNELTESVYTEILIDQYAIAYEHMQTKFPQYIIEPELSDDVIATMIAETYDPKNGARPIREWVKRYIEDQVLEQI